MGVVVKSVEGISRSQNGLARKGHRTLLTRPPGNEEIKALKKVMVLQIM